MLGDGKSTDSSIPVVVSGVTNATAIAGGSCALLKDGTVKCWGSYNYTEYGNGNTSSYLPATIPKVKSAGAIAVGDSHACAACTSGEILCWGQNGWGQLGNGTTNFSASPVAVTGL